ncbi:oxidoreductase FAD-binding protein [Aspergillus pseudonomiae]|uniref:Oxidoreductase FAD-binding protein n=1 Tax=Aspergillus pseudonomiae TaxID=1506151 RepID=A0A5N7DTH3_9EURO|nr:oxidoreductase FAD-binding protein [Aspergillus pseudonomiae]KAB8262774.1 oxidoreductase FAD-binding protein [Aspergillus pseudonomiae]KAE8409694.1 oxidoreductase FAD-binding protein [Aspergillus pseudonomiae]
MASLLTNTLPWHDGEIRMRNLFHIPPLSNPTVPALSYGASYMLLNSPLLAIGAVDREGRPWTTLWGGEVGFAKPTSQSKIEVKTPVDIRHDPLADILLHDNSGESGQLVSGLVVDLATRKRAKLFGRKISGSIQLGEKSQADSSGVGIAQLLVQIEASLGNCPKYINIRNITPTLPTPRLISESAQLPSSALKLLDRADTLFISSRHGDVDMDTNIRGGPAGFVRVISNEPNGAVFAYPEYSGNRLYQTLGNLQTTPLAGFVFPDFETGNALYLTGQTEIFVGKEAAALLPRSNLAVRVTVTAARYVEKSLAFRGVAGAKSPYNPSVRYLATEKASPAAIGDEKSSVTAMLVKKELLTPTICRFRFQISDPSKIGAWVPGQYATLSFQEELDMGYSHMKDDDPSSINDDYVRTFTISSYPVHNRSTEFEITARKHGNVTNYLFRTNERAGLEVPLKGFGGDFYLKAPSEHDKLPFIAGGIGITPLLAQLPGIGICHLRLLWSISIRDLGLVLDTFNRFPRLPHVTSLFITGPEQQDEKATEQLASLDASEARVERRRMEAKDLDLSWADVWYFCGGPSLKSSVLNWLVGKDIVYEDFNY